MSVQEFVELMVANGIATLEEILINGDNGFVAEKEVCSENYLSSDWKVKMGIDDDKLKSITFKKSMSGYNKVNGIDVSQSQDGGILMYLNSNGDYYDIDIVSNEMIYFLVNSGMLFDVDFSRFSNLESIKFNGAVDTSKVANMKGMFDECENLEHIYVGKNWTTSNAANSSSMFRNCTKLPNFDETKTDKTMAYVGRYLESKN